MQTTAAFDTRIFGEYEVEESEVIKYAKVEWTAPLPSTRQPKDKNAKNGARVFDFFMVLTTNPDAEESGAKQVLAVAKEKANDQLLDKKKGARSQAAKRQKIAYHEAHDEDFLIVARLNGDLLQRGYEYFAEDADMASSGLHYAACAFFDSWGESCLIKHQKLTADVLLDGRDLLFVDQLESSIPGIDLGINLMHQVFVFLKSDFSLVLLKASSLMGHNCHYEENQARVRAFENFMERTDITTQEKYERHQENHCKIQRQYARLGFNQTPGHPVLW